MSTEERNFGLVTQVLEEYYEETVPDPVWIEIAQDVVSSDGKVIKAGRYTVTQVTRG